MASHDSRQESVGRPVDTAAIRSAITAIFSGTRSDWPVNLNELRNRLAMFEQGSGTVATATLFHSNAPSATSPAEPRIVYTTPGSELYIGAIARRDGTFDMEFISWNRISNRYDFGRIRDFGRPNASIELADRAACLQCHRHGGPIFSVFPWNNVVARGDLLRNLAAHDSRYAGLREVVGPRSTNNSSILGSGATIANEDGVSLFFRRFPELVQWNGVNLQNTQNFQNQVFGVERSIANGSVRVLTAATLTQQQTPSGRSQMVNSLLQSHLLNEASRLTRSSRTFSSAERRLDQEVARNPANLPILFSDGLGANRQLNPRDFTSNSRSIRETYSESEPQHGVLSLPVNNTVTQMTQSLFREYPHLSRGNLDELHRREFGSFLPFRQDRERRLVNAESELQRQFIRRTYERLGNTAPIRALGNSQTLPTAHEVSEAIEAGLASLLGQPREPSRLPREFDVTPGSPTITGSRPCLSCHLTYGGRLRFTFDPADLAAWERERNAARNPPNPSRLRALSTFRDRVVDRLRDEATPMPPLDSTDDTAAFPQQRRTQLIRSLESLNFR